MWGGDGLGKLIRMMGLQCMRQVIAQMSVLTALSHRILLLFDNMALGVFYLRGSFGKTCWRDWHVDSKYWDFLYVVMPGEGIFSTLSCRTKVHRGTGKTICVSKSEVRTA